MTKRKLIMLLSAGGAAFLVVVAVVFGFLEDNAAQKQGQMVFAETFDKGTQIDTVKITTAQGIITLNQKDSFWFVKERGNYYADFATLQKLLMSLNQSVYAVQLPLTDEILKQGYLFLPQEDDAHAGMLIQTYIGENLVDEMIVGTADKSGNYFFARHPNENAVWLIDGDFKLPIISEQWILRPILSIPENSIEQITIDGKTIAREKGLERFEDSRGMKVDAQALMTVLKGLFADDALNKESFEKTKTDGKTKHQIEITTFFGLKFDCTVYETPSEMWIKINLTTTPLPKSVVSDYIKETRFLYDEWYFSVSPSQQKILRYFISNHNG